MTWEWDIEFIYRVHNDKTHDKRNRSTTHSPQEIYLATHIRFAHKKFRQAVCFLFKLALDHDPLYNSR